MADFFEIQKTEKLLLVLDNEIEQKCLELKESKKNAMLKRVFFLGCVLAVILPVADVFLGFPILLSLVPVFIFQAVSLVFLMPVILNSNGGRNSAERVGYGYK